MKRLYALGLVLFAIAVLAGGLWLTSEPARAPDTSVESQSGCAEPEPLAPAGVIEDEQPLPDNPGTPQVEAEEETFSLRGRVVFSGDWPAGLAWALDPNRCGVRVLVHPAGRDPVELSVRMGEDWSYSKSIRAWDLEIDDEDFDGNAGAILGAARWEFAFAPYDPQFNDLTDLSPPRLPLVAVTPRIHGDLVEFPDIVVTPESGLGGLSVLTGRITHESGQGLRFSEGHWLTRIGGDSEFDRELDTDGQGRFVLLAAAPPEPGGTWTLHVSEDAQGVDLSGAQAALPGPVVRGCVHDFGDITVGGALLKVNLKGEYGDDELVRFVVTGSVVYNGADLRPVEPGAALWLPEGRFDWYGRVESDSAIYERREGVVMLDAGDVKTLDLEFAAYKTIPVTVTVEGERGVRLSYLDVHWVLMDGDRWISRDSPQLSRDRPGIVFMAPVAPVMVTRLSARAHGFLETTAEAGYSDDAVELVLRRSNPPPPPTELLVTVPPAPPGLEGLSCTLVATLDGRAVRDFNLNLSNTATAAINPFPGFWRLEPGDYMLELHGGAEWGYAGGLLSGPVAVTVLHQQTVEVVMPDIPTPPWPLKAASLTARVEIGGMPGSIDGWMQDGVRPEPRWARLSNRREVTSPPVSIRDGGEVVAVKVDPPTNEDSDAVLSVELEPRIEVRVWRNGQPVDEFSASATSDDARCEVWASDGRALLWLPPGPGEVRVFLEGGSMHRKDVEVTRGVLLPLYFDLGEVRVDFQYETVPQSDEQSWLLLQHNDESNWVTVDSIPRGARLLEPGRYRLVPYLTNRHEPIEFELTGGGDRVIKVPALPKIERGHCLIELDMSTFGDAELVACLWYDWADVRPESRVPRLRHERGYGREVYPILMRDGLRLENVPLGHELILYAYVDASGRGDDAVWLAAPTRVQIKESGQRVKPVWHRAISAHDDWLPLHVGSLSHVPGYATPILIYEVLYPGRHEVVFYNRKLDVVHRAWVTVPQTSEPFAIPPALRAELVKLGLLDP